MQNRKKLDEDLFQKIIIPLIACLLIGISSWFHPGYTTSTVAALARIKSDKYWMIVHFGLLIGVLILDISLWKLFNSFSTKSSWNIWSFIFKLGIFINIALYIPFLSIDGFAGAILANSSAFSNPVYASQAVSVLFASPVTNLLGLIGGAGWILASLGIIMRTLDKKDTPIFGAIMILIGSIILDISHAKYIGSTAAIFFLIGILKINSSLRIKTNTTST